MAKKTTIVEDGLAEMEEINRTLREGSDIPTAMPGKPAPAVAESSAKATAEPVSISAAPGVPADCSSAPATSQTKQQPLPPAVPTVNPLADENGVLLGSDFQEQWKIASMMASSEMVPDHFRGKPAAVLMAIQTAKSRGLNPLTAIQQMANIFGRTSTYGEIPLAEAFASDQLEDFEEYWIDKDGKRIEELDIKTAVFGAVCVAKAFTRRTVTRIFTIDDAKTANLIDQPKRPTWQQYRKRMLQMRARGWALKDCVPQVTAGMEMPGYDEHEAPAALPGAPAGSLADQMSKKLIGEPSGT